PSWEVWDTRRWGNLSRVAHERNGHATAGRNQPPPAPTPRAAVHEGGGVGVYHPRTAVSVLLRLVSDPDRVPRCVPPLLPGDARRNGGTGDLPRGGERPADAGRLPEHVPLRGADAGDDVLPADLRQHPADGDVAPRHPRYDDPLVPAGGLDG